MKLSVKSSMIASLLMAVALSCVSYLGYDKAKTALENNFQDQAEQQLDAVRNYIDLWIQGAQVKYQALAEADEVKSKDIARTLEYSVRLTGVTGNPDEFAFIDADGTLYLPGATADLQDFEHFRRAMAGETVTVDPIFSKSPGAETTPIVLTAAPVKDDAGAVVGVANGGQPIQDLIELINKVKLGRQGYALVYTQDGTIVAGERMEDTLQKRISDYGSPELDAIVPASIGGATGIERAVVNGEEQMIVYGKAAMMDWGIAILVPKSEAYAGANDLLRYSVWITALCLLGSAVIIYLVMRRTLRPISAMNAKLRELASGEADLTARLAVVNTRDEIGELSGSFNRMLDNLGQLVLAIRSQGQHVAGETGQLLGHVEAVSSSVEQATVRIQEANTGLQSQMSGYERNLARVGEISGGVSSIVAISSETSDLAVAASDRAQAGETAVQGLTEQMDEIQQTVRLAAAGIGRLGERSQAIDDIAGLIASIASRTNILALNASIEAARAGEEGKGFAVVAGEIRKLAEQSTASASQIAELIHEVLQDTSGTVVSIERGMSAVERGRSQADQVRELFDMLVAATSDVSSHMARIAASASQLNTHADRVEAEITDSVVIGQQSTRNFEQIAAMSEEQLASMLEMTGSVQQLARTAEELKAMLNRFNV